MRALACCLVLLAAPRAARAIDPFEIQVYDGTTNAPGEAGLELHLNYVARGLRGADAPELPLDRQLHATLEPSIGVAPWLELGAYLQSTVRPDGGYDYAGVKLRAKTVLPPRPERGLRLGLNVEVSLLPEAYDRERWGMELRPIVGFENDRWLLVANPIVDLSFQRGPSFQPAALLLRKLGEIAGVGLETYSSFDGPQQHYLYEVASLFAVKSLELSVGVGEGLTAASQPLTVKMIVGYGFSAL